CPDADIAGFAAAAREAAGGNVLALLHRMLDSLHADFAVDPALGAATAAEAFSRRQGAAPDLAHIFIAAAHSLGVPARYVGGYVHRDGANDQNSTHAWAEAFVPELGWVAFDAANGICPTEAHVRVAVGIDQLGAMPLRGTR